jgi:hypothetical protein
MCNLRHDNRMLDRMYAVKGQLFDSKLDPSYTAQQAITDMTMRKPAIPSTILTVVFAPWHISKRLIRTLEGKYLAQGSNVLICNFSPHILSRNAKLVTDSFIYIADTVSGEVNKLQHIHSFTSVRLVGYSLGNVMLSMTAEKITMFDDVTMVVPGSDLLNCLWHSIRTRRLRDSLEAAGSNYKDLKHAWSRLAPIAHIEALRGRQVHIILSQHDTYIPYRYGLSLVAELKARNIPAQVDINHHYGHLWTSAQHIFRRTA